ncbi:hypothetical protein GPECTOR_4g912 [Gonium pectorale]|uniref:Uncharacterized protein n=1 Tax=Gonium pectorale TaxID=33097 RepID=A0A150GZT6_GONPE|nr:hypothetical protein GPECTOR_4g912 [Gonium pectorale]|eukprot:KXZ54840.1 hypothetical protein GPECTOR_4g912 [Gonium pectorale]
MPRLHAADHVRSRLTAVRGIVDVGADGEDDEPPEAAMSTGAGTGMAGGGTACHAGQQLLLQQQQPSPPPQHRGGGEPKGYPQGGSAKGTAGEGQARPQQPEWGQLFTALSLGGAGRGSQRTDPVWAALGNNRGAGRATHGADLHKGAAGPAQAQVQRCSSGAPAATGGPRSRDPPLAASTVTHAAAQPEEAGRLLLAMGGAANEGGARSME